MDACDNYKKNYKGKTDSKARKEGYATPDITLKIEIWLNKNWDKAIATA